MHRPEGEHVSKRNRQLEYERLIRRMHRLSNKARREKLMSEADRDDLRATALCVEAYRRNESRIAAGHERNRRGASRA
jgi:hypothetical protein